MGELVDWDEVAADNDSNPPDGFPENMAYSNVNNSARELMAVMARNDQDTRGGTYLAGGTKNAITLTLAAGHTAYFDGMVITFRAAFSNDAATTIDVNGIGPINMFRQILTISEGTELTIGGIYTFVFTTVSAQTAFVMRSYTLPNDIVLRSTTAVNLSNAFCALVVGGEGSAQHIEMDGIRIQSKSNATTAGTLGVNSLGGNVNIGDYVGNTSEVRMSLPTSAGPSDTLWNDSGTVKVVP